MVVINHFFSSDYHLGQFNILKYDGRPFKDIHHMDETIIQNHNSVVKKEDHCYLLGDFSFNKDKTEEYLSRLNGKLFFIRGNHDYRETIALYKKYGTYLGNLEEINIGGQQITLCHYSMRCWNRSHRGSWHLYGHSHHSLPDDPNSLSFDVGINGAEYNYTPLSIKQVRNKMNTKTFKPIDHHEAK